MSASSSEEPGRGGATRESPLRRIARLTVSYDAREDRLRFTAIDHDNFPLVLWLTRRLADRMVGALVSALDKTVEKEVTQAARAAPAATAVPAAQLWQQTEADLRMKKSRPVVAPTDISEEGLIESVRLRVRDKRYQLELDWATGNAGLAMDQVYLRQLLRILYRHYQQCEWLRDGVWPDWFADDAYRTLIGTNQVN